jgi:hypothetical protein
MNSHHNDMTRDEVNEMVEKCSDEATRVARIGDLVSRELLALAPTDRLLLVVDETGWDENGDIAESILAVARGVGAETVLVRMEDAPVGSDGQRVEYLPDSVASAMPHVTALVSLTRTTSAPLPHHHTPIGLIRQRKLRGVFMVKRSRADLLGESVLGVDFQFMGRVTAAWTKAFGEGSEVHVTNASGTDLRASIQGVTSHCSAFAHEAGVMSPINWGEVYQGPRVGTTDGRVVVDGPILGYGWPDGPVTIEIERGRAVAMDGPAEVVDPFWRLVRNVENGTNIAEIAVGINPRANDTSSVNVYKKGLGRLHVGLGNGLVYDQGVDSEIHIDCVLPTPTVTIDGQAIIVDGRATDASLTIEAAGQGS